MTYYEAELERLAITYKAALAEELAPLKAAIASASESSVIGVGSGGSFTVASLLCNLHETYTGRVSRPSTPLEIICNPTLAAASPVFLISAEGQNPDIIEALLRARQHSARTIHIITNRKASLLADRTKQLSDVSTHFFEIAEKDGYLATNSLLMDAVLVARAYGELDQGQDHLPSRIDDLHLGEQTIDQWLSDAAPFVEEAVKRRSVIVTYSPLLRSIATDLESKLSEAALLYSQLADLRSFAHGRHLWLAERPNDCVILALVEPSLHKLWSHTRSLIPAETPVLAMPLGGAKPRDLLAGLVAQMRLVAMIARCTGKDVGRPNVPKFGRELYHVDLTNLIPSPIETSDRGEQSKHAVLGARWPSKPRYGFMSRALATYKAKLEQQAFRAIVFDYDGTLCHSHRHDAPPSEAIVKELIRLLKAGVLVGIASGRGGSIPENLQQCLPKDLWPKILLGLYNGGKITDVGGPAHKDGETSEFISHVERIARKLKILGVPIEKIRVTHPYQVSVRFPDGIATDSMWFVIADALRQAGLDLSSMVSSKHSVDILAAGVGKSRLIAHIIKKFKIEPHQILTMGDQGAWPGNDSALLEHRFSLSVDLPSRRLDRGWNLAPPHKRHVDATLWYLERVLTTDEGAFRLDLSGAGAAAAPGSS